MKKLVALLAAAVLMAGTATLVFWFQLRAERERGAQLAMRTEAPAMTEMTEVKVSAPGTEPGAAAAAGEAPIAVASTRTAAPEPARADPGSAAQALTAAKNLAPAPAGPAPAADPMGALMKSMMLEAYPDLAAELDLTAAQAEQLLDLFARQQADVGTVSMSLMSGGGLDTAKRLQQQQQMLDKELAGEAEIKKMLGSKYPRWQEYQSTAQARQQVTLLRTSLAGIGKPLTEPQAQALTTAFAAQIARARGEDQAWVATSAARNSPNLMRERTERQIQEQRQLVDLAAPHLDAAQLEHFRRQNEQAVAMASSMLGMMGGEK